MANDWSRQKEDTKRKKRFTTRDICVRLVNTYPDHIVHDNGLDITSTCENFAEIVSRDFDKGKQKYYFSREFEDYNDCLWFMMHCLPELSEVCEEFLESHEDENNYL